MDRFRVHATTFDFLRNQTYSKQNYSGQNGIDTQFDKECRFVRAENDSSILFEKLKENYFQDFRIYLIDTDS